MLPFELTKDTPYLALSGELWSVFYEYFTEIDRVIKGFYCMYIPVLGFYFHYHVYDRIIIIMQIHLKALLCAVCLATFL